jgi:hypothetical protein
MIHLIYIYFIVNAVVFGFGIAENEKNSTLLLMALFGTVITIYYIISGISIGIWRKFSSYWMLETWWRYCVINKPFNAPLINKKRAIEMLKKEKMPTLWHKMIWKKFIKTHNLDIKI